MFRWVSWTVFARIFELQLITNCGRRRVVKKWKISSKLYAPVYNISSQNAVHVHAEKMYQHLKSTIDRFMSFIVLNYLQPSPPPHDGGVLNFDLMNLMQDFIKFAFKLTKLAQLSTPHICIPFYAKWYLILPATFIR